MAMQRGDYVEVYDEHNHRKCSIYAPTSRGGLQGYTSTTVNIKSNNYIDTYDENGHRISSNYCG